MIVLPVTASFTKPAIGVLDGLVAMHVALDLENYSKNITIYTNGEEIQVSDKFTKT